MVAKAVKLALLGFLAGIAVGALVVVIIGFTVGGGSLVVQESLVARTGSEAGALLVHLFVSGVFGAIPMAGVVFYEIDSWGLLKQAVVHYATYTAAFMLLGTSVGWFDPTPLVLGLIVGVFLICHCIIWLIMYARCKAETAELNELLQEAKQSA